MAALLGSAALLASMTVATVAAPASAGNCLEWLGDELAEAGECYYVGETPIDPGTDVDGFTLNGTSDDETVARVWRGGTFNGGPGNDTVTTAVNGGSTFNGGRGDDTVASTVNGTFNGGPGNDAVDFVAGGGTFNGGPGNDCAGEVKKGDGGRFLPGTFAGGGGSDWYNLPATPDPDPALYNIWSAEYDTTTCPPV